MDIRRFGAQYRSPGVHPGPDDRDLRDLLRHPLPERGAPGRPAAAPVADLRAARGARARSSARSRAGSARTGSSRTTTRRRRARSRPRGWAGPALVAGDRRRGAGHAQRGRPLRRVELRQDRGRRAGRARPSSSGCAPTTSTGRSARSSTPRCSTGAAGSSATSPSPASADDRFLIVTGTAFGNHDLGWIRRHAPDDGSVDRPRRDLGSGLLRAVGSAGPRRSSRRSPTTTSATTPSRTSTAREITVGAVPVLALRVTYVGELGWELYPPTEYGRGLWDALWEAGRDARPGGRRLPGHRRAAAREGLPRLVERHHARRDAVRGRPRASPSRLDKGAFIGRDALLAAKAAGPRKRLRCLVLDDPRSVASATSRSGSTGAIVGRVTTRRLRLRGRALDRLRLPAAGSGGDRDPRARSRCSVSGSASRSPREPLYDPTGERIRA